MIIVITLILMTKIILEKFKCIYYCVTNKNKTNIIMQS
jgi:hypothetical protein